MITPRLLNAIKEARSEGPKTRLPESGGLAENSEEFCTENEGTLLWGAFPEAENDRLTVSKETELCT